MGQLAAERIDRLETLAKTAITHDDYPLAREYVRLAQRIAERNRIALSAQFKRHTCDACDLYLIPGQTARVRVQAGTIVWTCDCGAHNRYPYDS